MQFTFYIYKIINLLNNKIYVGKRKTSRKSDGYFGSGLLLKQAIKKYGKENFKKEIIEFCEDELALREREKFWIRELNTLAPLGYNIHEGGYGGNNFIHHPDKEKIINKIRKSHLGKKLSKETKQNMSQSRLGKSQTPCSKELCKFCNKNVDVRNLKRWHNENCKHNPENNNTSRNKHISYVSCLFCRKTIPKSVAVLWHLDYCKFNPNKQLRNYDFFKLNTPESQKKARRTGYKLNRETIENLDL